MVESYSLDTVSIPMTVYEYSVGLVKICVLIYLSQKSMPAKFPSPLSRYIIALCNQFVSKQWPSHYQNPSVHTVYGAVCAELCTTENLIDLIIGLYYHPEAIL